MSRPYRLWLWSLAAFLLAAITSTGWAIPYASAVRNSTGNTWEFVLNEAADNVTVNFDVGDPLVINNPAAGRHTFDLNGASTFDIAVAKNAAVGWTEISDQANLFTNFERPAGLAINTDPSSQFFGTVYVNNTRDVSTASGRAMAPGLYGLTADLIGVDLANNFAAVTDPNDTSFFRAPGFNPNGSESSSPWRITLDDGGHVIVADWSDGAGGVKYASPDLSTGGLVLDIEEGPPGGVPSSVSDQFGPIPLHGSMASEPRVTGTVGVDLTLWGVDEDLDPELSSPNDDGRSVWRWDVGSATNYDINPTLVIDAKALGGDVQYFATIPGVRGDAHYSAVHDKWYLTQNRFDGNQAGLLVVTADGFDGRSPTVDFSSIDFSMANGLDGLPDVEGNEATTGPQDIFRQIGTVEVSPDGSTLYIHRHGVNIAFPNPTVDTEAPGAVLIIPLDDDGVPIIELDDNGTPGDGLDDFVTNWDSITIAGNADGHTIGTEVEFDAAGNIYTSNNFSELVQAFSPGGNTIATTTSNGMFDVMIVPDGGVVGDYNNDGAVNAADYTVWRNNLGADILLPNDPLGGVIGPDQYDQWKGNYGATIGSGAAAVPEPTGLMLLAVGGWLLAAGAAGCRQI